MQAAPGAGTRASRLRVERYRGGKGTAEAKRETVDFGQLTARRAIDLGDVVTDPADRDRSATMGTGVPGNPFAHRRDPRYARLDRSVCSIKVGPEGSRGAMTCASRCPRPSAGRQSAS